MKEFQLIIQILNRVLSGKKLQGDPVCIYLYNLFIMTKKKNFYLRQIDKKTGVQFNSILGENYAKVVKIEDASNESVNAEFNFLLEKIPFSSHETKTKCYCILSDESGKAKAITTNYRSFIVTESGNTYEGL